MSGTIAAISTPPGQGGIGVVRLSGPDAKRIAAAVFQPAGGRRVEALPGYTCLYGRVCDADGPVDDAVLTYFAAPHSYTGEDVVELSCHGGNYLPARVLETVLDAGAEGALPGAFTRRAFENGKLSLTQAESVMDLIGAEGALAARSALAARDGALFRAIRPVTDALLSLAAHFAAYIDFPEEDVPALEPAALSAALAEAKQSVERLLATAHRGRLLRQGIATAIVGRPNVGKSSLMNLLAGCRRSLVTPIAGTTRDVVEEYVSYDGLVLRLADTAGIRETDDLVEREGVELAEQRLRESDLVLAVFDLSEPLGEADRRVLRACADVSRETPVVAVLNKSDLRQVVEPEALDGRFTRTVILSAQEGTGLEALWSAIREAVDLAALDPSAALLANDRQKKAAAEAAAALGEALAALEQGWTLDAVSISVDGALESLLALTGERVSDEVVDAVFAQFCVGK